MNFVPHSIKRSRADHGNTRLLILVTGLVVCALTTMVVSASYKMSSVAAVKKVRTSGSRQTSKAHTQPGSGGNDGHRYTEGEKRDDNEEEVEEEEAHRREKRSIVTHSDAMPYGGATYIRWGRTTCPNETYTELVYAGIAGGSHFTHEGGATNFLCLPNEPIWGRFDDGAQNLAFIYGVEYEDESVFDRANGDKLFNNDMPCVVCRSSARSSSLMVPGRNICYKGWHLEYHGYLMAGHYTHKKGTEYICVDEMPEVDPSGYRSDDGALLYRVEAACGSLPCPRYVQSRELTCSVCSK